MKIKVQQLLFLIFIISLPSQAEPVPASLVQGLTSESFAQRESSQLLLLAWARERHNGGIEILKFLRTNDDPEIQKRSSEILRQLSDEDYLTDGQGYLGISMLEENIQGLPDAKPQIGIRILNLVKGSPAEVAGLKAGDLILALDGETWNSAGAILRFSDVVGKMKPLTEVILTIKRIQPNPLEVHVKLGKRPISDLRMATESLELLDERAKERHFQKWLNRQKAGAK